MARPDSGNRSFLLLVGSAAAFRVTLMLLACCVVGVVGSRLLADGPSGLWAHGGRMLPAALLAALIVVSTGALAVRAVREARADIALRRMLRARAAAPDARVSRIAARFGLTGRVRVVDDEDPYAFTHGYLRPGVVLSVALARALDDAQLSAVLAHESAHVRGRDPLKVLVARLVVSREFHLPLLRHVSARFVAGRELAADRRALRACGAGAVAGALLRVLGPPDWARSTPAAAMAADSDLRARISQLETGVEPCPPPAPRGWTLVSLLSGVLVLAAATQAYVVVQWYCGM
ncbi:M56 family metallopeptidase [Nocardiopsis tropica]|uniref:M56 family metallopeptidase n=1 Tax=Nocardiopsis tropica TaxID=109330 RepID=A0ABU7KK68_9ACTN|nr:M56 family metallopeptidase [Nocardiopsis umidischolae]MEE2049688.1 M56 family metallopeptidase [Nocardiopsis umidischolae]